ncbi:MAG: hypothetical protein ACT4QE_24675 [Anaerolineales bacterium]
MTTQTDDTTLRALAAAVKDVRVPTSAAWARVCAALASPTLGEPRSGSLMRPLSLRPMMASLTVVTAFFVFSQFGLINALVYPTVTAGVVPGPRITNGTPVAGLALPAATTTPQPATSSDAVPIPLPPNGS